MNRQFIVAPSILSADFSRLGEEVRAVEQAGADRLHIDVMDGHFVPNLTIGVPVVKSLKKISSIPLDIHLMANEPEHIVPLFLSTGVDSITIHLEALQERRPEILMHRILEKIHQEKIMVGVALKPKTPVEKIFPFLSQLDLVLIMTVEPGFGGQSFLPEQIPKISAVKKELAKQGLNHVLVHVDGGVNDKMVKLLSVRENAVQNESPVQADVLVAGHFVFKHKNYKTAISLLKKGGSSNERV